MLAEGWFLQGADAGLRQITWPAIEPHRDYIVAQLKTGVTPGDHPPAAGARA